MLRRTSVLAWNRCDAVPDNPGLIVHLGVVQHIVRRECTSHVPKQVYNQIWPSLKMFLEPHILDPEVSF
jgi:hypothetical protein